jgi:hypothetical protein
MAFDSKKQEEAFPGSAEYRFVLDLERARVIATMVARSRASAAIEMVDMVAGMYLSNWERLSRYWMEEEHDRVEGFLRRICQISPQRWNSWITFYDAERRRSQRTNWGILAPWKADTEPETPLRFSADLAAALREARQVAPFRDAQDGRQLPVITTECLLLSIANTQGSQFARQLVETGLDLPKLDQEARNPRHTPAG